MTPERFFAICIEKTHNLATKYGFVKGGVKLVPELMQYCERLINSDLSCEDIIQQYPDNAELIQAISYRCLMYGIILANTWYTSLAAVDDVYDDLETNGPNTLIQPLVEGKLNFTPKLFSQWMEAVYITCLTEFGSIEETSEEYSYKIMMACYQTGISMMLSHFGM